MLLRMVNRVFGDDSGRFIKIVAAGVQIASESWEVTAGDFDPDPMPFCKEITC